MNDELIQQVITGNMEVLWNLLGIYKEHDGNIKEAYERFKNGLKIKYHINYNLKKKYNERPRSQEVELNGNVYSDIDWWEEEDARKELARNALMEYLTADDKPWEDR